MRLRSCDNYMDSYWLEFPLLTRRQWKQIDTSYYSQQRRSFVWQPLEEKGSTLSVFIASLLAFRAVVSSGESACFYG